jgi:hypothetical protein
MAKIENHHELLENEWFHVRHSGEIPEIALHSSIYYLTEDSDGPNLQLQEREHLLLFDAVLQRYREIILRDLLPENRDTTVYRGVLRSICNWRRLKRFCERHHLDHSSIMAEVKTQFLSFLQNEVAEVAAGCRSSCINCTFEELYSFAVELNVPLLNLRRHLEKMCLVK